jgi:carboxymethylenebutenolidase
MGFHVEVESQSGCFRAYEAPAVNTPRAGTILLLHDWFGLNERMRAHAEHLAAHGFHALAIDLYRGMSAASTESARRLAGELKVDYALHVVEAAAKYARAQPHSTGKVGLVGFCLGGAIAMAAGSCIEDVSATVTFCGLAPARYTDGARLKTPVMGHYAVRDPLLPIQQPQAAFATLSAAGRRALFHRYEAGYAFMRADSQTYHPTWAELAWKRTVGMFQEELQ